MNPEEEATTPREEPARPLTQQQQQQPTAEHHAGQGSESALRQMHAWEQRRAAHAGKRRQG